MPKKRKTLSTAKSEKLWIQETLKRLRAFQATRESAPPAAKTKKARPAKGRPSRAK
ncbi:MAG TPA: hypothetical protein VGG65_02095 [Thermoanaerobaculia bacterium]|jgi:hypothetical protein